MAAVSAAPTAPPPPDLGPAPLWRRLVALIYDGLLYIALLMTGLVLSLPFVSFFVANNAQTPLHNYHVLEAYAFIVGLGFFGWSWARGGQTLGMRVWRLQVRRLDGAGLRGPIAVLRFATGYGVLVAGLWASKHWGVAAGGIALLQYLPALLSERGQAVNDYVAGTEVVTLPRA
jgi:uncharacterized RDD family membrane protein YckC